MPKPFWIKAQENTIFKDSNYNSKNESFPPSPSLLTQFKVIAIAIIKAKLILQSPLQIKFWVEHIKDQHKNQTNHVNCKEQKSARALHRQHAEF